MELNSRERCEPSVLLYTEDNAYLGLSCDLLRFFLLGDLLKHFRPVITLKVWHTGRYADLILKCGLVNILKDQKSEKG